MGDLVQLRPTRKKRRDFRLEEKPSPNMQLFQGSVDLLTAKERAQVAAKTIGEAQVALREAIADLVVAAGRTDMLAFADASLMPFRDRSCGNE
jgi:hypothetical protein